LGRAARRIGARRVGWMLRLLRDERRPANQHECDGVARERPRAANTFWH
jgi:hypothetical protein